MRKTRRRRARSRIAARAGSRCFTRYARSRLALATAPIAAGGPRGEWVTAAGVSTTEPRILFYIHGGGFTAGSAAAYRGLSSHLSAATGCRVLAVDYRWAPEEPFPAALDDCVAAYRWLVTAGGAAPRNVVLAGDSAGGNLVVAMLLALKQDGDELPAAGVCLSPIFDLALTGDSVTSRAARDPMILASSLQKCSAAYRGNSDPRNPLMSPLYGDLAGLPPLLLQCGSEEMLRDDSVAARRQGEGRGRRRHIRGMGRDGARLASVRGSSLRWPQGAGARRRVCSRAHRKVGARSALNRRLC